MSDELVIVEYDPSEDETLPMFIEEEAPTRPVLPPITIDWEDL